MIFNDPYQAYKTTQTQTASRGELVVMLYNGAIKFLNLALEDMKARNTESAHQNLLRAQDIIAELMGSLNMDAGKLAKNLFSLYEYMLRRLVEANYRKAPDAVEEVLVLLRELLPMWQQAAHDGVRNDVVSAGSVRSTLSYAARSVTL